MPVDSKREAIEYSKAFVNVSELYAALAQAGIEQVPDRIRVSAFFDGAGDAWRVDYRTDGDLPSYSCSVVFKSDGEVQQVYGEVPRCSWSQ